MNSRALIGTLIFLVMLIKPAVISAADIINLTRWESADGGNDHWYAIMNTEHSWIGADSTIAKIVNADQPGHLVTITSAEENQFITDLIIGSTTPSTPLNQFWTAGYDMESFWMWENGEEFGYSNWDFGEPGDAFVSHVITITGTTGLWRAEPPYTDPDELMLWSVVEWEPIGEGTIELINLSEWRGHWYAVIPAELSWEAADSAASSYFRSAKPGYLATVQSQAENDFILNSVMAGTNQPSIEDLFWIGGKMVSEQWTWITGEMFPFVNWSPGEPNNFPVGTALGIWGPNNIDDPRRIPGKWNDALPNDSIHALHHYWAVVEWGDPHPALPVNVTYWPDKDGGNNHWYGLLASQYSWQEARTKAEGFTNHGEQGYLATVTTPDENEFILNNIIKIRHFAGYENQYWLGGEYTDSVWAWITGETFFGWNWAPDEPNNIGHETALGMWGFGSEFNSPDPYEGKWNNSYPDDDVHSLHHYYSIIEWGEPLGEPVVIPTTEWINVYCDWPLLDGVHLGATTVIDAYDPDGALCGSVTVENDGGYGFMPIYRDDIYTDFDEGAEPGDLISFMINGQFVSSDPEVIWDANGSSFNVCVFSSATCDEISLSEGWNLISWNKNFTADVESLIADFKDKVDRILGFENGGLTYVPGLEEFSNLQAMDYSSGYWFKMKEPVTFEICGGKIESSYSIPISPGWNLLSYWPDDVITIETALESIIDNTTVTYTFDSGAKTWLPGLGTLNTLTEMSPGLGYWLYSNAADVLVYPGFVVAPSIQSGELTSEVIAKTKTLKDVSKVWISAYGKAINFNGTDLSDGSKIEFVTTDGVSCGSSIYSDGLLKFTPVYGKEAANPSTGLFPVAGDEIQIVVNGNPVMQTIQFGQHGGLVRINDLTSSKSNGLLPDEFALYQNFPNPFNPSTEISFALASASDIRLTIYNVLGQEIATIANGSYGAGYHQIEWAGVDNSGQQVSSGIYFYRLTTDQFVDTKKMILLK